MNRRQLLKGLGGVVGVGVASFGLYGLGRMVAGVSPLIQDISDQTELEEYLQTKYNIEIIGDTNGINMFLLYNLFNNCEKNWGKFDEHIKFLNYLDFRSGLSKMQEFFDGGIARAEQIMIDGEKFNVIRISSGFKPSYFIHELTHIYHFNLKNNSEFEKEWQAIANIEYGGLSEPRKDVDGKKRYFWKGMDLKNGLNGCMRAYGAKNIMEDVATYNEGIFDISLQLNQCPLNRARIYSHHFSCDPRKDPRYSKKLELLVKNDFISQREYDLVKPLFIP